MSRPLGLIALALALSSLTTHAQLAPDPAHASELARSVAAARAKWSIYRPLPAPELEDWIDPSTGSSTRSAIGCAGLVMEATLSGDRRKSYVTTTLYNASSEPMRFSEATLSARFGDGAYRRLDRAWQRSLEPGSFMTGDFELEDKQIFEDQVSLEVALRVVSGAASPCTIAVRFERSAEDQDAASYTAYHNLELGFGAGVRFAESGGQAQLQGGSRLSLHIDFAGFFGLHHGIAATVLIDRYGSGGVERVTSRQLEASPSVNGGGFFVGYIGRLPLASWLHVTYTAATGPSGFEVNDDSDRGPALSTTVLGFRQRLRLTTALVELGDEWLALGASLEQLVIPYGELGEVELGGQSLAATLDLILTN